MSEEAMYNVEKILDRRKAKNKLLYKIKWEGYPMNQCTWEPLENLKTVWELVEEYDKSHPMKTNKKGSNKNNFLGKKKDLPPEETKEMIKIIDKKPEVAQEEEKIEKIGFLNDEQQQPQEPYTIIPPSEICQKYKIDDSLKRVKTVRKKNEKLMAVIEKMKDNGDLEEIEMETNRLKTVNPWILLDFYESKIKFAQGKFFLSFVLDYRTIFI